MNEPLDIIIAVAVGLIALAAVAVVIALVPMIRKARQILSRVDTLIESTERDVRQTVGEVRGAVHNVNQISGGVHKNMDQLSGTVKALEGFGETLRNTSDIIRTSVHPHLLSFGALLVGLKTGSWYLLRKIFLKRRR
jgi:uncharacterized protein YoxC